MNCAGSASAKSVAIARGAAAAAPARPPAKAAPALKAATATRRNPTFRTAPPLFAQNERTLPPLEARNMSKIFLRAAGWKKIGASRSRRKAGHSQFAHLRRPPRKRVARLRLVADRPQRSVGRAHLHGDAGEGIEHGRRHPGEIGAGERLRPGRERLAPGPAVRGRLFARALEQERGAHPRLPRRRAL